MVRLWPITTRPPVRPVGAVVPQRPFAWERSLRLAAAPPPPFPLTGPSLTTLRPVWAWAEDSAMHLDLDDRERASAYL